MKKKLLFSLALVFVLSFASLVGTPGIQKAEAADWTVKGTIWTDYYHYLHNSLIMFTNVL